ncbi:uncharacterized protein EI97DRAFT_444459 [Westerdykella ornata]|uniref:Uncharacterized protein n=1 Tax=Westerdykella ornata TaxID=318751 RepID=A0A6A6JFE0_WESOR|nr:uncharacterized protein EI97DRAFT_444459 [Westerdykella ornata]KAF2273899.1 hypothetical protein EI97DRAFT_444459 [Westerdykella ornata]
MMKKIGAYVQSTPTTSEAAPDLEPETDQEVANAGDVKVEVPPCYPQSSRSRQMMIGVRSCGWPPECTLGCIAGKNSGEPLGREEEPAGKRKPPQKTLQWLGGVWQDQKEEHGEDGQSRRQGRQRKRTQPHRQRSRADPDAKKRKTLNSSFMPSSCHFENGVEEKSGC